MLWAYTDCLAKKGPTLKSPADQFLIGADPVSGRNQQIDLAWEQLCLSTAYEFQIAKDEGFHPQNQPGHQQRQQHLGRQRYQGWNNQALHGFHQRYQPGCLDRPGCTS